MYSPLQGLLQNPPGPSHSKEAPLERTLREIHIQHNGVGWVHCTAQSYRSSYNSALSFSVSLYLKVRSHRAPTTRSSLKPWQDHLASRSHLLTLNQVQIDCLKSGLKFGKAIGLPEELKLNAELMCDILVPRDPSTTTVRYFTRLQSVTASRGIYVFLCSGIICRYFFKELHTNLTPEDLLIILTYLRGVYDHCLTQRHTVNYSKLSPSGTLDSTLSEVGRPSTYMHAHTETTFSVHIHACTHRNNFLSAHTCMHTQKQLSQCTYMHAHTETTFSVIWLANQPSRTLL